jgi:hypothetical protein
MTYPCPSCGAPIEPLPGKTRLPCPYCGSATTIPDNLRIEDKPVEPPHSNTVSPYFIPPPPPASDDITDVLRQVEPFATNAVKAYGFWFILRNLWRRVFPVCAIVLMILCILVCAASVLIIFLSQRGG